MPEIKPSNKALFDAVKRDNFVQMEHLLDRGADVNVRNEDGCTPLHRACINGRTDIARLLLDRGADMEARNDDGRTPLHWACQKGHTDIARLLLDRGTDVNAKDYWGHVLLHIACIWGHSDIARLLIERGADADVRDNGGRTPLDFACGLPEGNPRREEILSLFRDRFPEAYFTKFCETQGRMLR